MFCFLPVRVERVVDKGECGGVWKRGWIRVGAKGYGRGNGLGLVWRGVEGVRGEGG